MIRLKNAYYIEDTGYSKVVIQTDIGTFEGEAFLHPDDKEHSSKILGCSYAEARATIKYYKKKASIITYQIQGLKKALNDKTKKTIYKTINKLETKREIFRQSAKITYQQLQKSISEGEQSK